MLSKEKWNLARRPCTLSLAEMEGVRLKTERETETDRERETDRDTERERQRQTDRQTDRDRDRERENPMCHRKNS